jgi:CheY-like chemotaxis protein
MAEHEEYASTDYMAGARMIDLGERRALVGRRVLVVDDDPGVRDTISDLLRAEGCEVSTAGNGRVALDQLERERFDFVVSDVVMPEMDGYELYKAVRHMAPDTHVVLMTAFYYDKDHILKRSRLEGLEGVLFKKPIDPDRLRQTLENLLEPRPS